MTAAPQRLFLSATPAGLVVAVIVLFSYLVQIQVKQPPRCSNWWRGQGMTTQPPPRRPGHAGWHQGHHFEAPARQPVRLSPLRPNPASHYQSPGGKAVAPPKAEAPFPNLPRA